MQGTMLTSGIALNSYYSQQLKGKSINRISYFHWHPFLSLMRVLLNFRSSAD